MDDEAMRVFCGVPEKQWPTIRKTITPAEWALYERMAKVEMELMLYDAGLAPKPAGVIICRDHGHD